MKVYVLFCVIIVFCNCSVNTHIAGKYASRKNPNCFQLNEDSTFIYEYREFHAYEYSTGLWEKNSRRTVILNSNITNTLAPLKVIELDKLNAVDFNLLSVNVDIAGQLNAADYKCRIFVNDTLYGMKRCDSLSAVQISSPVSNIYFELIKEPRVVISTLFSLYPIVTDKFFLKNTSGNNLKVDISFDDSLFSYKPFNEETLRIKENSLKLFNSDTNKWEQIPKVPDTAKIFIRH